MGTSLPRTRGKEPETNADYLKPQYWEQRFEQEEQYDWFKGFQDFRSLLLPHLKPADRILVLGCGNSTMTAELWREGLRTITSIDLSEVVIRRMEEKAKAAGMHSLRWQVADMLDLPFGDGSFDVVLEKGTMDVLFVDNDSPWQPKPEVCSRVHQMLSQVHRVLTPGGVFLSITFAQPHFRRPFFRAPQYTWGVQHASVGETFHYFVYALRKGSRSEDDRLQDDAPASQPESLKEAMTHEHMDEEDYLMQIDL